MPSTCLNHESRFAPPPKRKSFKNKKISSQFIEPRGDVFFETLLNCKVSYRNRSVTNQLSKFENILILRNILFFLKPIAFIRPVEYNRRYMKMYYYVSRWQDEIYDSKPSCKTVAYIST